MLFNSLEFLLFFPLAYFIYWSTKKNLNFQNLILLILSYIFYGFWDFRFLYLIFASSIADYTIGYYLCKTHNIYARKVLLCISLTFNIGLLFIFKYFNFFIQSFNDAFVLFSSDLKFSTINIILPVGISFYTFQTLSYTIDIYNKKVLPTKNIISFLAFVSFFPQLVAGPIERASTFLPQFLRHRRFNYNESVCGLKQILWGFFKKLVIADNCAELCNLIFENYLDYSGITLLLGSVLFSIQIYGDFSGYSDIAIGTGRLLGFRIMKNFNFPYFSENIQEFWRNWHISLTTWFRDYIYYPLGGSRNRLIKTIINIFIVFLISGLWHGANWTFIFWGFFHAFLLTLYVLYNKKFNKSFSNFKTISILKMLFTFSFVSIVWVFFRAETLSKALNYILIIFSNLTKYDSYTEVFNFLWWNNGFSVLILLMFFFIIEWLGKSNEYAIEKIFKNFNILFSWSFYVLILICIVFFMPSIETPFIYFQF